MTTINNNIVHVSQNQITYTNESNELKLYIEESLSREKISQRDRVKEITQLVILFLENNGSFIKSDISFYYFLNFDKTLYDIMSWKMKYILSDLTWLPYTDNIFKSILASIESHTFLNWKHVEIKKFSYYDVKNNVLYLHNNKEKIIKITKESVITLNNWDDGIIFLSNQNYKEWHYIDGIEENKLLDDLIDSLSFNDDNLSKEELIFIVKQFIFSLFFPELMANRPVITFIWDKWSWKSFFLEQLLLIFFWECTWMWNMPSNDKELKINLVNEYLCFFDNVDDKVSNGKIDILCSAATWISIKMRALFTNKSLIETKVNCYMWITSRNPTFKRDDFSDRLLIINLNRRGEFSSSSSEKIKYQSNRDQIMSQLCIELQEMLKKIEVKNDYKSNFRLSDFVNFVLNNNKDKEEYVRWIFVKLEKEQQELANSTDTLLILIEKILEDKWKSDIYKFESWKFHSSNELHDIFSDFAKNSRTNVVYWFNSPKSLWKVLGNNIKAYKVNNINIIKQKFGSNLYKYSISKIVNEDSSS